MPGRFSRPSKPGDMNEMAARGYRSLLRLAFGKAAFRCRGEREIASHVDKSFDRERDFLFGESDTPIADFLEYFSWALASHAKHLKKDDEIREQWERQSGILARHASEIRREWNR